jgi:rhodanese-related sulfurtransferase
MITTGFQTLVEQASAHITTYTVAQVVAKMSDPAVQLVDVRDIRELEREGVIPGGFTAWKAAAAPVAVKPAKPEKP